MRHRLITIIIRTIRLSNGAFYDSIIIHIIISTIVIHIIAPTATTLLEIGIFEENFLVFFFILNCACVCCSAREQNRILAWVDMHMKCDTMNNEGF